MLLVFNLMTPMLILGKSKTYGPYAKQELYLAAKQGIFNFRSLIQVTA